MWSQFLNESRSQRKFDNRPVVILGSKHSGKRSVVDSLLDISKTNLHHKRSANLNDGNKMRLKGVTTAIDYAYLNVMDITDPDNRTHAKLELYMVEEIDNPSVYSQLASPDLLKSAFFIIMLDFTNPWNFIQEIQKWVKFIYELQQMAKLSIADLQEMARRLETYYKKFREAEFDQNGKLKVHHNVYDREQQQAQLSLPLPDGVLTKNMRVPLLICVNKCDLQSQVLREESTSKILVILYHLRSLCISYGASLIYTSIRNNCNLNVLYQYIIHRAYSFPFRYRSQPLNQQAIFIPLGYDKPTLINDSVVKINISRPYNQAIPQPTLKKNLKQQIVVEQDSKFFEKYINQGQSSSTTPSILSSEKEIQKPQQRKQAEVTDFFKNLLQGGRRQTTTGRTQQQNQRLLNAQKELMKHTSQILEKKNQQQQ